MLLSDMSEGGAPVEINSLAYDNRSVEPGSLFFCVPGSHSDGHDHAAAAIARGACALVVERPLSLGVPELVVSSVREAMPGLAASFYGDPSASLRVIAVTGTNGKTTTTFLIRALLEAAGERCGLLGTVKSVIGGVEGGVIHTTPEAIDLQRSLAAMRDAGDVACAMEVSSHALVLHRADAIHFAAAVFTNLTRDHLDFHGTMDAYFAAKRALFDADPQIAVVSLDDRYGARIAAELPDVTTFALDRPADYRALHIHSEIAAAQFTLASAEGEQIVRTRLPGRFNVANVLAAVAVVHRLGVDLSQIVAALADVEPAPGRFQALDEGQSFAVLIDYAHTPDSLQNVLRAARELTDGRVICVFGCGGDRDRGKRPEMGRLSAELADVTLVTSDNPRSESPEAIVEEIVAGAHPSADHLLEVIIDRASAINRAIALADAGDVVVIAGKGHEQGQEFEAGRKVPFDDAALAREQLRRSVPASR